MGIIDAFWIYCVQLLEWLQKFTSTLKARTNAVADEVQQVVEEIDTVELNLSNTFNTFRLLSSSQFVANVMTITYGLCAEST
jgi:hypothetical protein